MTEERKESSDVEDSDIVFDCPHCGKSLAIDYRGAGLTIPCSDCGRNVEVPIPDGMQISDIDSTAGEQEVRILNMRRSLQNAESRIDRIEAELRDVLARRDELEKGRGDYLRRSGQILERVGAIERALKEIGDAVRAIGDIAKLNGK
jgi:transcription elongation factor Elf1